MRCLPDDLSEAEVHRHSRHRRLIIGLRAYERLRLPFEADLVIVVDRRLPPTMCQRLSYREYVTGGEQFAREIAGENAVIFRP